MTNVRLPDNLAIVGIGGAGKELAFRVLEQDWITDHYLQPTEVGINRSLKVYTIDTATAEHNDDLKRSKNIENTIEEQRKEHRGVGGSILLDPKCLTKFVNATKPSDLTRGEVRTAVRRYTKVWWLEDPERGLEGQFKNLSKLDNGINQDFAGGTYRRRAISKAVFYKALSERNPVRFNVVGHRVAVVAGLGGGTGSGMFFDVAKELRTGGASEVTLFAILPTTSEGEIEKINAYVALSELEYANLNNKSPFDYVVLLPFEPTGFSGTMGSEAVEEFDEMFPSIITSSYHSCIGNSLIDDKLEKYTRFILADGCIIKYGIEDILEIKKRIEDVIKSLKGAVEEEGKLREVLSNKLNIIKERVGNRDSNLTIEDYRYLDSRLKEAEIWNKGSFEILGYDTVKKIIEEIDWQKNQSKIPERGNFEGLMDYVDFLESILQNVESRELDPRDNVDKGLLPILIEIVNTLKNAGNQIKILSDMDIEITALLKLVKGYAPTAEDEKNLRNSVNTVQYEIKELTEESNNKRSDLEKLRKMPGEVEERATIVCNTLDRRLTALWNVQTEYKGSKEDIDRLDHKIGEFIKNTSTDAIEKTSSGIKQKVHDENDLLDQLKFQDLEIELNRLSGLLPSDFSIRDFLRNVAMFRYHSSMHEFYEQKYKEIGTLAKIFNMITGRGEGLKRDAENAELNANRIFESLRIESNQLGVRVGRNNIDISIKVIISERMEKRIGKNTTEIMNFIREKEGDELAIRVETILEEDHPYSTHLIDAIREYLKEKLLERGKYEELKNSLESDINNINIKIEEAESRADLLRLVKELVDETRGTVGTSSKRWQEFRKKMDAIDKDKEKTRIGRKVTYVSRVKPDLSVLAGVEKNIDMGHLFKNIPDHTRSDEIDKIMSKVTESVNNVLLDRSYLGVEKVSISYNDGAERWNFGMGVSCINTSCEDISNRVVNEDTIRDLVNSGLDLGNINDVTIRTHNVAGKWDVGLTLFALPTFLDNLQSVVAGGGYKAVFDIRNTGKGGVVNILHHALLLEEGKIVYRKDILQSEETAKYAKAEATGKDISDEILDMHKVVTFWRDENETQEEI